MGSDPIRVINGRPLVGAFDGIEMGSTARYLLAGGIFRDAAISLPHFLLMRENVTRAEIPKLQPAGIVAGEPIAATDVIQ